MTDPGTIFALYWLLMVIPAFRLAFRTIASDFTYAGVLEPGSFWFSTIMGFLLGLCAAPIYPIYWIGRGANALIGAQNNPNMIHLARKVGGESKRDKIKRLERELDAA